MDYKLMEELKNAGFSWDRREYYPTLEELIEACGAGITLETSKLGCRAFRTPVLVEGEWSETPREAVARLWLALNKK